MIEHPAPAGSNEWIEARLGLPTASQFHKLLTPKTMKASASADEYLNELLAEWLIGEPLDPDVMAFMQRGRAMEDDAIAYYEALYDVDVTRCGLCLTDDGRAGATPDGFIGEEGILELKCPGAKTHVDYLRTLARGPERTKYFAQKQGQLWIAGRQWLDFMSYHPTIRPVIVRYVRDEAYIDALAKVVTGFCNFLDQTKAEFLAQGITPVRQGQALLV